MDTIRDTNVEQNLYKELSAPISVQIEITSSCNNNCIHCYNHWREKGSKNLSLSLTQLFHIAKQLKDNNVFSVTLTGGEPLLVWKRISAIIKILVTANINVSMNSNLTLMTPKVAVSLKESGLKAILVSVLDEDEKIHDLLSNKQGAWKQTIHGIKIALDHGFHVSANMVLLKQNHEHIYKTAKFLKSIGVNSFSATKASPALNSRNFDELRLTKYELMESIKTLEAIRQELEMYTDILECYLLCFLSDLNRFWHYGRRSCTAGVTTCTIGSDGNIRPCSHADMTYGNIFQENLSQIFKKMSAWRLAKYTPDDCKLCKYFRMCSGGCRMEAKYLGDICGKDPYMTTADDIISKPTIMLSKILPNQKYKLTQGFVWRMEDFGAIVTTQNSEPLLVNTDGLNILHKLSSAPLSISNIEKELNLASENLAKFFSEMVRNRIISSVD